jgi:hypothetical protein
VAFFMQELFPIICGVAAGVILGAVRPALRLTLGVLLSIVFGVAATVLSGEFRVGWEYLLIDIPLVAMSAAAMYSVTSRAVRRMKATSR